MGVMWSSTGVSLEEDAGKQKEPCLAVIAQVLAKLRGFRVQFNSIRIASMASGHAPIPPDHHSDFVAATRRKLGLALTDG